MRARRSEESLGRGDGVKANAASLSIGSADRLARHREWEGGGVGRVNDGAEEVIRHTKATRVRLVLGWRGSRQFYAHPNATVGFQHHLRVFLAKLDHVAVGQRKGTALLVGRAEADLVKKGAREGFRVADIESARLGPDLGVRSVHGLAVEHDVRGGWLVSDKPANLDEGFLRYVTVHRFKLKRSWGVDLRDNPHARQSPRGQGSFV